MLKTTIVLFSVVMTSCVAHREMQNDASGKYQIGSSGLSSEITSILTKALGTDEAATFTLVTDSKATRLVKIVPHAGNVETWVSQTTVSLNLAGTPKIDLIYSRAKRMGPEKPYPEIEETLRKIPGLNENLQTYSLQKSFHDTNEWRYSKANIVIMFVEGQYWKDMCGSIKEAHFDSGQAGFSEAVLPHLERGAKVLVVQRPSALSHPNRAYVTETATKRIKNDKTIQDNAFVSSNTRRNWQDPNFFEIIDLKDDGKLTENQQQQLKTWVENAIRDTPRPILTFGEAYAALSERRAGYITRSRQREKIFYMAVPVLVAGAAIAGIVVGVQHTEPKTSSIDQPGIAPQD